MRIEPFDDGSKLMAKATNKPVAKPTQAQRVRALPNPYLAAVARCVYRQPLDSECHLSDKKIFHFEDGSFLTFEVTYTAVEDGGGQ